MINREFPANPYARSHLFVGADAYIGPADCTVFTIIFGKFVTSQRADVGIGPYRILYKFTAAQRAEQSSAPTNCAPTEKILTDFLRFFLQTGCEGKIPCV